MRFNTQMCNEEAQQIVSQKRANNLEAKSGKGKYNLSNIKHSDFKSAG